MATENSFTYKITSPNFRPLSYGKLHIGKNTGTGETVWLIEIPNYTWFGEDEREKLKEFIKDIGSLKGVLVLKPKQEELVFIEPDQETQNTKSSGYLVVEPQVSHSNTNEKISLIDAVSLKAYIADTKVTSDEIKTIIQALSQVVIEARATKSLVPILCSDTILLCNNGENRKSPVLIDMGLEGHLKGWNVWLKKLSERNRKYLPDTQTAENPRPSKETDKYSLAVLAFEMLTQALPGSKIIEDSIANGATELCELLLSSQTSFPPKATNEQERLRKDYLKDVSEQIGRFVSQSIVQRPTNSTHTGSPSQGAEKQDVSTPTQQSPSNNTESKSSVAPQSVLIGKRQQTTESTQAKNFDSIEVTDPKQSKTSHEFKPSLKFMVVGDDPANEISLTPTGDEIFGLLPRHFCIWHVGDGQYTVTDMEDTGEQSFRRPTLLNGIPLSPAFAARFTIHDEIQLGNYRFRLQRTNSATNHVADLAIGNLAVGEREFEAKPGDSITIPFTIEYLSDIVEEFLPILDGVPSNWKKRIPTSVRYSGSKESNEQRLIPASIQLIVPTVENSSAKTYHLILRIISYAHGVQIAAQKITIRVLPEYHFSCRLQPTQVSTRSLLHISVKNRGNHAIAFVAQPFDNENALKFRPDELIFNVRPGQTGEVVTEPLLNQWRIFGREKLHPITIEVTPRDGGEAQQLTGIVISQALIPPFVQICFLLMLALVVLLASTIMKPTFAQQIIAPDSVPIAGKSVELKWKDNYGCFYSLKNNNLNETLLAWNTQAITTHAGNPNTIIEISLRNCLLIPGESWKVTVAAPTPPPMVTPSISQFSTLTQTLWGLNEPLCFEWQVNPLSSTLTILPVGLAIDEASAARRSFCVAQSELLIDPITYTFALQATNAEGVASTSAPVNVAVYQPICTVKESEVNRRSGPGLDYETQLNRLNRGERVLLKAKPFFAPENRASGWAQIVVVDSNDPRVSWVDFTFLQCAPEILSLLNALPLASEIPEKPTATATVTPLPTGTPLPAATPTPDAAIVIAVAPPVIDEGACALLSWSIQNVLEVRINGEGVIGEAEKPVCPTITTQYKFEIKLRDGTIRPVVKTLVVNSKGGLPTPPVQQ